MIGSEESQGKTTTTNQILKEAASQALLSVSLGCPKEYKPIENSLAKLRKKCQEVEKKKVRKKK